jgi:K+-sensing histidine kinase KdpD
VEREDDAALRETLELMSQEPLFANVSHELRTPLTLILARLVVSRTPRSVDERRETEMMERNARLLYRHVVDLLDTAKIEAGGMSVARGSTSLSSFANGGAFDL